MKSIVVNAMTVSHSPLLFDHVEEVSVIYNPFEYRTECKSIMPAESCRKPKDWNSGPNRWSIRPAFRGWNCWMKEGQNAAISEARARIISPRKNVHTYDGAAAW
jgi:hypothetical protein